MVGRSVEFISESPFQLAKLELVKEKQNFRYEKDSSFLRGSVDVALVFN